MDWVKLGDVAEIQMGVSPSSSSYNETGEGLPFYQGVADFGEIYPNERVYTTEAKRIANEGDILIGVRAPVGKVNINKKKSSIGRGLASLKSKDSKLNNKFIFYQLKKMESYFELNSTGSTFKAINKNIIESAPFVVYKADHNIKIVKKLDIISELISTRKAQIAALDELVQSVFYEMFGENSKYSKKFTLTSLNKFGKVRSSKRVFKADYVEYGVPFYRGKEITELAKNKSIEIELFISKDKYTELRDISGVPSVGDLLITSVGTIGNIWIVNNNEPFYFKDGNILWFLTDTNICNSEYLKFSIELSIKSKLKSLTSGTSYKALTISNLENLEIPLPPLELQKQFAAKIEAIETQKAKLQTSLEEMETLFDALMQESFSGNLG